MSSLATMSSSLFLTPGMAYRFGAKEGTSQNKLPKNLSIIDPLYLPCKHSTLIREINHVCRSGP